VGADHAGGFDKTISNRDWIDTCHRSAWRRGARFCSVVSYHSVRAFFDAGQSPNIGELKLQILDYKCFGGYDRDVAKVLAEARVYIETRAGVATNPAIIPIDETSLSNWPEILANDFGYVGDGKCASLPQGPCGDRAWELLAQAPALTPTLELFRAVICPVRGFD
jgi:hypothetical protein